MVVYNVRQAGGEPDVFEGIWLPGFGANPYAGTNGRQCDRHQAALFTRRYEETVAALRKMDFAPGTKGVPLEYFVFERLSASSWLEAEPRCCQPPATAAYVHTSV